MKNKKRKKKHKKVRPEIKPREIPALVGVGFSILEGDKVDIKYSFAEADIQKFIDLVYYIGMGHLYPLMIDALKLTLKPEEYEKVMAGLVVLESAEQGLKALFKEKTKERPVIKPSDVFNRNQGII